MIAIKQEPQVSFLHTKTKQEAIATLVQELELYQNNIKHTDILEAVMQREQVISTGIGIGIALPHAKIPGMDDFHIVIGIASSPGIPWEAIDSLPVRLILLIVGPDDRHGEYLQLLSRITRNIKQEEVRQSLFLAKDRKEVVKIFEEW